MEDDLVAERQIAPAHGSRQADTNPTGIPQAALPGSALLDQSMLVPRSSSTADRSEGPAQIVFEPAGDFPPKGLVFFAESRLQCSLPNSAQALRPAPVRTLDESWTIRYGACRKQGRWEERPRARDPVDRENRWNRPFPNSSEARPTGKATARRSKRAPRGCLLTISRGPAFKPLVPLWLRASNPETESPSGPPTCPNGLSRPWAYSLLGACWSRSTPA